jgi:hypothetical protein
MVFNADRLSLLCWQQKGLGFFRTLSIMQITFLFFLEIACAAYTNMHSMLATHIDTICVTPSINPM